MYTRAIEIGGVFHKVIQAEIFDTNNTFSANIIIEFSDDSGKDFDWKQGTSYILHGFYHNAHIKIPLNHIEWQRSLNESESVGSFYVNAEDSFDMPSTFQEVMAKLYHPLETTI